ncbi:hypothetical protein NPIL_412511 [Nephila pilipes]|uniref:Uncharacterized protein n=1 Tax=Nephila pilipes TaxID=299642 RepID=A0A8X6N6Z4_NEPPI|nr:hypothetical protein NPIL_412511 [Nephila pilipes]
MVIAMIFEVCLLILQCALRAFVGFFDLLYFIEVIIFDSMIEFIDYSATNFWNRVFTTLDTTADAALIPFPTMRKTCEALELKSQLVSPQGTTTMPETPYERNDRVATVPVVRSYFVWKMCGSLDLPATFVPEQSDTTVSRKQFHVNQPVPIVNSVEVFEMCKALGLRAKLAHQ